MDLWPYKDSKFFMKSTNFIMLYTGNFVLHYYVGFSQIRSQLHCVAMRYAYNSFIINPL